MTGENRRRGRSPDPQVAKRRKEVKAGGDDPFRSGDALMGETHSAEIAAAIRDIRSAWRTRGTGLYEINDGGCYDFAGEVMERLFGADWVLHEGRHGWRTLNSEELYAPPKGSDCTIGATGWDWELLARELAIVVPEADRARHDAIVSKEPSHCWIHVGGRHYDCEHPDGVESFFDLNFFRRWLAQA